MAVLETGRRTATYKLATLMALLDHCVEHMPDDPGGTLIVPVSALAERVLELYWLQVLPFDGGELKQTTQPVASILRQTVGLREAAGVGTRGVALAVVQVQAPKAYAAAVSSIALTLAQQPLSRLQHVGAERRAVFLYDDSWMHPDLTRRQLTDQGGALTLHPGVATALARLSGLLKLAIEVLWVDEVRRWNKHLAAHVPDIAGHLFDRDRISLNPAREALRVGFGSYCFYCHARVGPSAPVDHVLPWSRVGLDGLANLVLACPGCNGDKGSTLPAPALVEAAAGSDRIVLEQLAEGLSWPTQYDRMVRAARGLYRGQPPGSPVWIRRNQAAAVDFVIPDDWLLIS